MCCWLGFNLLVLGLAGMEGEGKRGSQHTFIETPPSTIATGRNTLVFENILIEKTCSSSRKKRTRLRSKSTVTPITFPTPQEVPIRSTPQWSASHRAGTDLCLRVILKNARYLSTRPHRSTTSNPPHLISSRRCMRRGGYQISRHPSSHNQILRKCVLPCR